MTEQKVLKVSDLKIILSHPHPSYRDEELRILLTKPSVGARATCGVVSAVFGFDWEQGMFLLNPAVPLVPKSDKEKVWDAAQDLLMYLATKPVKAPSYEVRTARAIFDRLGKDYMQYQKIFHPEFRK